ncbi:MAG: ABC transporter permease subunit, partial [Planctomycetota bacterium]
MFLRRPRFSFWPLICLIVSVVVALPVLTVASSALQPWGEEWQHLADTRLGDYFWNTLWLALGVATITACLGTAAAWLVTMCDFPGRWFLRWSLLLPLAVPAYLSAYAYTDLLQFSGPVQTWLRETFEWGRRDYWFPPIRSLGGAIAILSMALLPYVYITAQAAFIEQSTCALEAGRTLGRGPWRNFFTVAVPLARPSIAAGTALVLMETFAEFGAVDYCAVDTFATGVYRAWKGLESPTTTAQLSTLLLTFVVVLVLGEQFARRRARFHHAT